MNVIHLVSNREWGGGERYVLDLACALRADGHSVAIITKGRKAVDRHFEAAGFTPGRLPLGGMMDFISPLTLARVLNRIEGDMVIHVHNFKDADIALRARRLMHSPARVRVVMTRHLVKPGKNTRYFRSIYDGLDELIFVSESARDEFLSTSPSIDPVKVHMVHNASSDMAGVEAADKPEGEFRLVFAGRIVPEKGVEVLIHALSRLTDIPGIRLHIAGEGRGRYVLPLMQLARRLGVDKLIEWHGLMDDVLPLMASADAGVVPSVWKEPFGLVLSEFMSLGVPVVASAQGGPLEIITDGKDGVLVPPSKPDLLAEAIRRLADDSSLREGIGHEARKTIAERFSYGEFYKKILALYHP